MVSIWVIEPNMQNNDGSKHGSGAWSRVHLNQTRRVLRRARCFCVMVREVTPTYLGSRNVVQHRSAGHRVCGSGRVVDAQVIALIGRSRNKRTLADREGECCGVDADYSFKTELKTWDGARCEIKLTYLNVCRN
jgi:hypothetical protein